MRPLVAAALLLSSTALFAAEPKSVDLSGQFPGAAVRDQGDTNTCHVFSTVAQLEAAVYRRWGLRQPLSEADLFVRKVVEDPAYYDKVRQAVGGTRGIEPVYRFVEWGDAKEDIEFAIKNGIARAETAPWPAFAARYAAFVKERKAEINAKDKNVVLMAGAREGFSKDRAEIMARQQESHSDYFARVESANLQRVDMEMAVHEFAARKDFNAFLKQLEGKTHEDGEQALLGPNRQRAKDHAVYKTLLQGFRVAQTFYDSKELGSEACRAAGAERKKALLASFDRGIPVGLSMDVGGLKEWNVAKGPASHAFAVTGYTTDAEGRVTVQSRNSWGGANPTVAEDRFCRISRILQVLGPND